MVPRLLPEEVALTYSKGLLHEESNAISSLDASGGAAMGVSHPADDASHRSPLGYLLNIIREELASRERTQAT